MAEINLPTGTNYILPSPLPKLWLRKGGRGLRKVPTAKHLHKFSIKDLSTPRLVYGLETSGLYALLNTAQCVYGMPMSSNNNQA